MIADTLGLSELISDSPSELAAVLGHELGHVFQQRRGRRIFDSTNAEFDADVWGLFLALYGGYDPYGAAGAMAKLAMVTGTAGLIQQFEQQLAPDAHKRLPNVYRTFEPACDGSVDALFAQRAWLIDLWRRVASPGDIRAITGLALIAEDYLRGLTELLTPR